MSTINDIANSTSANPRDSILPDAIYELELLERNLETALTRLRVLRRQLEHDAKDRGVLGSRGLTEFTIGLLRSGRRPAWSISELLVEAERAGYAIPTRRVLSKRLTEYSYRRGTIGWSREMAGWFWREQPEVKKGKREREDGQFVSRRQIKRSGHQQ